MKKVNFKLLAAAAFGVFSLSSCLKDDDHYTDFSKQPTVVEIPSAGFGVKVLEASEAPQEVTVAVNVASPYALNADVVATLAIDPDAVAAYNAKDNTRTFEVLPANSYEIVSNKVTIPAGQRQANFVVKVKTSLLDLSKKFMLPVKLTDASGYTVSGNFNTALVSIAVKNKYDGEYHSTGVFNHPTAGPRDINEDKTMSTIDATTVQTTYADLGRVIWLKVNADNTVTMIIPAGSTVPAGNTQFNIDADDNTYNPNTHTFKLRYKYAGAGGDRVVNETIVLKP